MQQGGKYWIVGTMILALCIASTAFGQVPYPANPVPTPNPNRPDRFGVYNWNVDLVTYPGGAVDVLNWGADKVAQTGSKTIRVYLGPNNVYKLSLPAPFDLAQSVSSPGSAYDSLFRDSRFTTYLLTTYSQNDDKDSWADGYSDAEYQAERDEIARLCDYLLTPGRYPNKTFIILNWEGDNQIDGNGYRLKNSSWDNYVRWVNSRADGVRDAMQRRPVGSSAKAFSGLEFNKANDTCGNAVTNPLQNDPLKNRCLIDYVGPRVTVDYYSFSSWSKIFGNDTNVSIAPQLQDALNVAISKIARLGITPAHFIIGEYGFQQRFPTYGECGAAHRVGQLFSAAESWGVSYAIYWQVLENDIPEGFDWLGFGLFKGLNGQLSLSGQVFKDLLNGQTPVNYTDCPVINYDLANNVTTGAVSHITYTNLLPVHPSRDPGQGESILVIFGTGFSQVGNVVHFDQGRCRYSLTPQYQSPSQINVALPYTRIPGRFGDGAGWGGAVYVTNANGRDSNAGYLELKCDACPKIRDVDGILNGADYSKIFNPGTTVAVFGSQFSGSGNKVVIEQGGQHYEIIQGSPWWYESSSQINATLPSSLRNVPAVVYVVNSQGIESNAQLIGISYLCSDCPEIRSNAGILNPSDYSQVFHTDSFLAIFGRNFSSTGNRVVIEQGSQRFEVTQGSAYWYESTAQINAKAASQNKLSNL